jgi:hypothetical protein
MSWKSQQNYTLGFFLNEATEAVATIVSGTNTNIYTSAPLPIGSWLVIVNDVGVTGTISQAIISAFVDGDAVASAGFLSDVNVFPSLIFAVSSNGTAEITIDVDCDTTAGTWDITAGKVQLVKLTNI